MVKNVSVYPLVSLKHIMCSAAVSAEEGKGTGSELSSGEPVQEICASVGFVFDK